MDSSPAEQKAKSFVYVIPTYCEDNTLNAQLMRAVKQIETEGIKNHILATLWGEHRINKIISRIDPRNCHAIITASFGRAKNEFLNYFELNWKPECEISQSVAMECSAIAMNQNWSQVRPTVSLRHKPDGTEEPNPLFSAFEGFGLAIKPMYCTYSNRTEILSDEAFWICFQACLTKAVRKFDEVI